MVVGGAERLVYDMVRHPSFADNPPVVCCLNEIGELGERLLQEGYQVYSLDRKEGIDFSVIKRISDIIRRNRINVVHAHQYTPLFYAVPAAFLAGRIKVVYTEHGRFYPEHKSWKRSLFNPMLAMGVDHLVSISEATARAMATYDNLPFERIKIIHNGIDASHLRPQFDYWAKRDELGLNRTCRIIGTAARLNSIKNIPMMLKVLKLVLEQEPDTCLVIAGQGEEEESLKRQAIGLGIADNVRFIGLRFDLPEIYQLFDVFLLTSFSEGISVTLLEAMASGVPAVVTDVGGNREVVVDGETGFLIPVDDSEMMSQKIKELLADRCKLINLGQNALKRLAVDFSFECMLSQYSKLYG